VSGHYYDQHCLLHSDVGQAALTERDLGIDCVRHARVFFDRPDYDLGLTPKKRTVEKCSSARVERAEGNEEESI
jgi:hypothetical protein